MPLCGFTEAMLSSLNEFNKELVRYGLKERSQENGESIEHALRREVSDMARLLLETHRIEDSAKRTLTEGMVKYALGFYLLVRKHGINETGRLNDNIIEYFRRMDEVYYSDLEGLPDDMERLADILNGTPLEHFDSQIGITEIKAIAKP